VINLLHADKRFIKARRVPPAFPWCLADFLRKPYLARSQPQLGWRSGARKPGRGDGSGLLLGLELDLMLWLDLGLELEVLAWVWGSKELGDGDPRSWWFINSNRWMPKLPP
jgi:hypothetical protein